MRPTKAPADFSAAPLLLPADFYNIFIYNYITLLMDYKRYIKRMNDVIRNYGLDNEVILKAMEKVLRHHFVPEDSGFDMDEIYGDHPLPIGADQTISQPYTVAFMLDLLELSPGMNVLEIGAGSGWNSALIKEIIGKNGMITTVEYVSKLAAIARKHLKKAGYSEKDVNVVVADGSIGYEKNAPYDRIIATCGSPDILEPWKEQLKPDGIIVAPVGRDIQTMT